jgi:biopolymer transport protein ExbB/TolQ
VDSSLIQTLFNFITNNIFVIIFLFVAVEIFLIFNMMKMMKKHEGVLLDVSDNLLKGFSDAPDKDSDQLVNERIQVALDYIRNKIQDSPERREDFLKNANKISQRPLYARHYQIEIYASIMSTLVQVFPLLGILGTILAIAQTAFQSGGSIDVSSLSNAFVLAMDTTILGITFSILFMVVESALQPKIERVINESNNYKKIIANLNMVNNG